MTNHINSSGIKSIKLLYLVSRLAFGLSILFSLILSFILIVGIAGCELPINENVKASEFVYENENSIHRDQPNLATIKTIKSNTSLKKKLTLKYQHFHRSPIVKKLVVLFSTLLLLSIMVLSTYNAKEFMRAINRGEFFERKTIIKLKIISYLLMSGWLISLISSSVIKFFWVNETVNPITKIHLSSHTPSIELLIIALILWVLSHVFMQGAILKEEGELTI